MQGLTEDAFICSSGINYLISSLMAATNWASKPIKVDLTACCPRVSAYHLLSHLLGHVFVQLEEELDGVVVLVLPVQFLGVVHAQPELQALLHRVVLLSQLHVHTVVLLEEGVFQEVLNGVPAVREENQSDCFQIKICLTRLYIIIIYADNLSYELTF